MSLLDTAAIETEGVPAPGHAARGMLVPAWG